MPNNESRMGHDFNDLRNAAQNKALSPRELAQQQERARRERLFGKPKEDEKPTDEVQEPSEVAFDTPTDEQS